MGNPFAVRYKHNGKFYIYDVNTNCILEVDEALFTLIEHVQITPDSAAVVPGHGLRGAASEASLTGEAVDKTIETIKQAYLERGLFSDQRPTSMRFPFSKADLKTVLSSVMCRLILGITENCNLRCAYCKFSGSYEYSRTHSSKRMTTATALKAVRFMMGRCSYLIDETNEDISITFYGGEPLLNFPVIRECVSFVRNGYPERRDRIVFALTSNLTTRREETVEYLANNGIDLTVSLDGPQRIHDRYRVSTKGAATFSQVKKNLQTLRRLDEKYYNEKVSFSVVITPPYQLEEIVDFFESDDLTRGHTTFVAYADRNFTKFYDSFDMSRERQALGGQIDRLQSRFGEGIRNGTEGPGSVLATFATGALRFVARRKVTRMSPTIYPNGICVPGAHRTFVNPDGKLYLCERVGESLPIGDLDSGYDIEAIDEVLQRYIAVSNRACRDCWAVRFCGACFMDALQGSELRESAKNNYCDLRRRSAFAALKEYSELIQSNPSALNDVFRQPDMISTVDLAMGCLESHKQRSAFGNGITAAADGASL